MCFLAMTGQDGVASLGDHVASGATEAKLVSAAVLLRFKWLQPCLKIYDSQFLLCKRLVQFQCKS